MPARAAMEMQPSRPPGPGGFAGFKLPGRDNPLAAAPKFESHRSRSERQSKFEEGWQSACFTGYQVRDSHFIEDIPAQTFPTEEAQQQRKMLGCDVVRAAKRLHGIATRASPSAKLTKPLWVDFDAGRFHATSNLEVEMDR